tara:strand:+ start:601 stop:1218 length:618 start_codon:yes stop_codon:yes gene_type:complete
MILFSDTYKEIKVNSKGLYKEKGSKFIAYAYKVYSEKEIKKKLNIIKSKEHAAQHHCYAYILNPDYSNEKFNDDGEPSSTAGRPILRQIKKNNLTNILIIVSRYFGGTKLGIPGLIRSYKTAANSAIKDNIIIEKTIKEFYQIYFNYTEMNHVMKIIKEFKLEIVHKEITEECRIQISIRKSIVEMVISALQKNYKIKIEYINRN